MLAWTCLWISVHGITNLCLCRFVHVLNYIVDYNFNTHNSLWIRQCDQAGKDHVSHLAAQLDLGLHGSQILWQKPALAKRQLANLHPVCPLLPSWLCMSIHLLIKTLFECNLYQTNLCVQVPVFWGETSSLYYQNLKSQGFNAGRNELQNSQQEKIKIKKHHNLWIKLVS